MVDQRHIPRQNRSERSTERLLEGAERVFARVGYERATTGEIAEEAGVSVGTLYRYFGDKQAVAARLADNYLDQIAEFYQTVVTDDPAGFVHDNIERMVNTLADYYKQRPALATLYRNPSGSEELRSAFERLHNTLIHQVAYFISGRVPDAPAEDVAATAQTIVEILRSLLANAASKRGDERQLLLDEISYLLTAYTVRKYADAGDHAWTDPYFIPRPRYAGRKPDQEAIARQRALLAALPPVPRSSKQLE